MGKVYLMENAVIPPATSPIQGTFRFCSDSGMGVMHVDMPEGGLVLDLGNDVWKPLIEAIRAHVPENRA